MDRVSASFHKNVLLLTNFVAPHNDFKKHFKEGMFDKPNTIGFIHVSYYLLNVYYKGNIKNKVPWPVICKQTESQFRNDMRKCLTQIASENTDVNFPPILASHLLLAGNTKFILIMWKFSLVVLRTYGKREHELIISNAPKPGTCQELTMTFLKNVTKHNEDIVSNIRKERQNVEQEAEYFLKKKTQEQNELKAKILKLSEDLQEIVFIAPANDTAKKRLLNIEDDKIVNLWTDKMTDVFNVVEKKYQTLEKLDEFLNHVNSIVLNITGDSQILSAVNLDHINIEPIYELIPPEKQVLLYGLYENENLNLKNLFSIFILLIKKCTTTFQHNKVEEIFNCNDQLKEYNMQLKTAMNDFQNLHKKITNYYSTKIKTNRKLNDSQEFVANIPEYAKVLFMPSPSIQIVSTCEGGQTFLQNDLKLTPAESTHKELFSRYAESNRKGIYLSQKKFPVQRINFDDDTVSHDISCFKRSIPEQRFYNSVKYVSAFKNANKYSRVFSSLKKINYNRVNNSVMTMMSESSVLPLLSKEHNISLMDSCNSSQEFSQEPLLSNPNLNSTIEPTKLEEKPPSKVNKRRSISDLVERYKNIVQKRDN